MGAMTERMSTKRAIIDIGSNTVRLVVYNGPDRAPTVVLNEKVTPRLGRNIGKSGLLTDKSMETALLALKRYAALIELMAIEQVQVVATAAARDATNGPELLTRIEALGLKPRLLSGEDEARISAMGVIGAFPGANGITGDLGGGSLELTRIAGADCSSAVTFPLGTLLLPELRKAQGTAFGKNVRRILRDADWAHGQDMPFFLVGGSWRALALYAMQINNWPLDDPHGFELCSKQALRICGDLAEGKVDDSIKRISSSRLDSLPHAAALLGALIEALEPSRIVFSSCGLREGLLYSALDDAVRAQDPLLAGVSFFVKRYDVAAQTGHNIAQWLSAILPAPENVNPFIPVAATLLALAAMRTEPNVRAEEALDWALRKRWIGLSAKGRALIATAVLANMGRADVPAPLQDFADKSELEWATSWGMAVRLARKLTNGHADALAGSSLDRDGTRLVLSMGDFTSRLFSASASKNLGRLAAKLNLEPVVEGTNVALFS